MTTDPYEVALTKTSHRALAEKLPLDVAIGASDFISGPLAENLHRVGKQLDALRTTASILLASCATGAFCTPSTIRAAA